MRQNKISINISEFYFFIKYLFSTAIYINTIFNNFFTVRLINKVKTALLHALY